MVTVIVVRTKDYDSSVRLRSNRSGATTVEYAGPSLRYMRGWSKTEVLQHAKVMGWGVRELVREVRH